MSPRVFFKVWPLLVRAEGTDASAQVSAQGIFSDRWVLRRKDRHGMSIPKELHGHRCKPQQSALPAGSLRLSLPLSSSCLTTCLPSAWSGPGIECGTNLHSGYLNREICFLQSQNVGPLRAILLTLIGRWLSRVSRAKGLGLPIQTQLSVSFFSFCFVFIPLKVYPRQCAWLVSGMGGRERNVAVSLLLSASQLFSCPPYMHTLCKGSFQAQTITARVGDPKLLQKELGRFFENMQFFIII